MTNRIDKDTSHWDDYWHHGFLTSCADAFQGNYQGRLRLVWEDFFRSAEKNTTILDIGTGNGAIALIASRISAELQADFEIHAIDQAEIDPQSRLKTNRNDLARICFHSKTPAEHSGLPDRSVNRVSGQYALEYTRLAETITELGRICAPGAKLLFVMHHADSVVLQTAAEELGLAEKIDDSGFFDHAGDLLAMLSAAPPGQAQKLAADPKAEACRNQLNRAAAELNALSASTSHPQILQTTLQSVGECFKKQHTSGDKVLQLFARYRQQIAANLARLRDLQNAAVSEKKGREIVELFETQGFVTEPLEDIFHEQKLLAGRILRISFPGGT